MPETLFGRTTALAGLAAAGLTFGLAAGTASAQSIAVGQSVNGALTSSDPRLSDGSHFNCYNLQTRAGERLQIDQAADLFDSFLMVRRGGCNNPGDLIAHDDDGGPGLDSRLVLQGDGTLWAIIVNSVAANATGTYQLRVSAAGAGQAPTAISAQPSNWQPLETSALSGVWAIREEGDLFSDGPYSFYARTEYQGAALEFGCHNRDQLVLSFTPPAGVVPPLFVASQYAVNDVPAGSHTHNGGEDGAPLITRQSSAYRGPAAEFLEAMSSAWTGEIKLTLHAEWRNPPTGPAIYTHRFPFDEDELGGVSEMVLAACGLR